MTKETNINDKIIVSIDAMGGDGGVEPVIGGISHSLRLNRQLQFLIHGNEKQLEEKIKNYPHILSSCSIVPCESIIAMDEKPSSAIRSGKKSSMWSALNSLAKGNANIALSCGNTGALMAMSMMQLRKAPGINRPAIAILWPSRNQRGFNIVLDAGADIKADSGDLLQYTLMGVEYAKMGFSIKMPRVGLLNVGTEIHKGRNELHEASLLIMEAEKNTKGFKYLGYVEGGDLPSSKVDVIITDGFTGNVALKTGEGTASLIKFFLKESFNQSFMSKLGSILSLSSLKQLNKKIDPRNVNGGIFLGLNGIVIKSHGSADDVGVAAAINLAFQLENTGLSRKITTQFSKN